MNEVMGNYPVDLDDCTKVGMWGGCGVDCPIYQDGKCEYSEDVKDKS